MKQKYSRTFQLEREFIDVENRRAELAFSSVEPYERSFGIEVLDHSAGAVDMRRFAEGRAPLLANHDTSEQIGVVERAWIDSTQGVGRALVRFGRSALAEEYWQDVQDGIRSNVSVGYIVDEWMQEKAEESATTIHRAVRWTPMEVSIVSIPADISVGVGREDETPIAADSDHIEQKAAEKAEITIKENSTMSDSVDVNKVAEAARRDAIESERVRISEIAAVAKAHGFDKEAETFIREGKSAASFKTLVLDGLKEKAAAEPQVRTVDPIGVTEKESKDYSLFRAIQAVRSGDWSKAGLEKELSDAVAQKNGKEAQGFYIPNDLQGFAKRDLTVGTTTAGGFLKGTTHMADQFVSALYNRLVLTQLGARTMSGLKGDVAIPAMNAKTSTYWVAESGSPTEGAPTVRQITMAPKTVGAFVDISRKLMIQSDPSAEMIFRDDMLRQIAVAVDDVGIEGGATNTPTGITKTSGIGSVAIGTNGGAPTWASIVNLVREVEIDNADTGSLAFLTNPKVKAKLANTVRVGSTDSRMILEAPWNNLYGYNLAITNNAPSDLTKGSSSGVCSALIFGNFNDLIIGQWGAGVDVIVDPYTGSSSGTTRIVCLLDIDVCVRHAESFAACLDLTTT